MAWLFFVFHVEIVDAPPLFFFSLYFVFFFSSVEPLHAFLLSFFDNLRFFLSSPPPETLLRNTFKKEHPPSRRWHPFRISIFFPQALRALSLTPHSRTRPYVCSKSVTGQALNLPGFFFSSFEVFLRGSRLPLQTPRRLPFTFVFLGGIFCCLLSFL